MKKTFHLPFGHKGRSFVDEVCDIFLPFREDKDYGGYRVVFPGRRPGLYLRRVLSLRHKGSFIPPVVETMEDLVLHMLRLRYPSAAFLSGLDEAYQVYMLLREDPAGVSILPILRSGEEGSFFRIHSWVEKIAEFLSCSESERVEEKVLRDIGLHADLGFNLPEGLNRLLGGLAGLRRSFRALQEERGLFSRGYLYGKTAALCAEGLRPAGRTLFAGLFGLTASEKGIIGSLLDAGACDVVWHGDPAEWSIISRTLKEWSAVSEEIGRNEAGGIEPRYSLHAVRSLMQEAEDLSGVLESGEGEAVVVLPRSEALLPVLSLGLPAYAKEDGFNISLDYPVDRTALFNLVGLLRETHVAAKPGLSGSASSAHWSVKSYLGLIEHPFVRNIRRGEMSFRDIADRIRGLFGDSRSDFFTKPFIGLEEMESVLDSDERDFLREWHELFLTVPARALTLRDLSRAVEEILRYLASRTSVKGYVLSSEIFLLFFRELSGMRTGPVASEAAEEKDRAILWKFFLERIAGLSIHFDTRPLKPLEILGMLETRALNFRRVCVLDTEEGVLPAGRTIDPLVPLDLSRFLGLPSPEDREEMYRYYFFRLVRSAEEVHLFYREAADVRRSRYVEEIVWAAEKAAGREGVLEPVRRPRRVVLARSGGDEDGEEKDSSVLKALSERVWSVTALDAYLFCRIRFYYEHLLSLRMPEDFDSRLDARERGTILHEILEGTLSRFLDIPLGQGRKKKEIREIYNEVFEKTFRTAVVSGEHFLFQEIARIKLWAFLEDQLDDPDGFLIRGLEQKVTGSVDGFIFRGRLDRLDEREIVPEEGARYRILDYKSGGLTGKFAYDEALASAATPSVEAIRGKISSFQAVLYSRLFVQTRPDLMEHAGRPEALLVSLRNPGEVRRLSDGPKRGPAVDPEKVAEYHDRMLSCVLAELRDASVPFRRFRESDCEKCPYLTVCRFKM